VGEPPQNLLIYVASVSYSRITDRFK